MALLSGVGVGLLIIALLVGFLVFFILDIGSSFASQELAEWLKNRRGKRTRQP